ncbi:MAG: SGNH/GDSL hydrolase family protein, partial [Limisphaerales bacterium]
MNFFRAWFLLGLLTAALNAAEEKPFMSFFNPPSQPLPLQEHRGYWEIPGVKHDLPRLSAWLGSDGLEFAVRHFAADNTRAESAPARSAEGEKLAPAVECHAREGLPNFFAKLNAGGEVKIAYLGGSITAQEGWRPLTLRWFQEHFPSARISQINAAIGGTGSDLGVFRLKHDVLDQNPDLLFVEFAVNDGGAPTPQIERCMEGIVRQT